MDRQAYFRKLHYRAHHRGTREADAMIGGFFDHYHEDWSDEDCAWFERLMEQQDVDIMGWAMGTLDVPAEFQGDMMNVLKKLDFITLPPGIK